MWNYNENKLENKKIKSFNFKNKKIKKEKIIIKLRIIIKIIEIEVIR